MITLLPPRGWMRSVTRSILVSAALLLFSSCTTLSAVTHPDDVALMSSVPRWQQEYAELAQHDKVYRLDAARSKIRIYAFRAGTAAQLGHNHVLNAPQFSGWVYFPHEQLADARFDLEFRLDTLQLDDPQERARLGEAFASTPSASALQRTREHMLGEDNLAAEHYPFLRIHSVQVRGELPKLAVKVQIELHGQRREMWLPLEVGRDAAQLHVSGAMVLRQTDFGVQPYSVLGGFLAVQDELVIEFALHGE